MKTDCSGASLFPAFSRQLLTSRGNKASLQSAQGYRKGIRHPGTAAAGMKVQGMREST